LRQQQVNIAWCTVFLQTVSKPEPAGAVNEDNFEREKHHWWKAKKWAYFNLNRLFIRYAKHIHHFMPAAARHMPGLP
jgi:hypothetical protein